MATFIISVRCALNIYKQCLNRSDFQNHSHRKRNIKKKNKKKCLITFFRNQEAVDLQAGSQIWLAQYHTYASSLSLICCMCICLCMRVSCLESVLSSLPSIHMREISVSQLSLHVTNPQARQHLLCLTLDITSYMSNDKLSLSDKPRPWTDTSYLKKKKKKG